MGSADITGSPRCGPGVYLGLLLLPVVALVNCSNAVVRLAWPVANTATLLILFVAPPAFALIYATKRLAAAGLAVLAGIELIGFGLLACLVGFHLVSVIADGGTDYSFERISSTGVNAGSVVVYRTNGGATTDFGVVVRHEVPLIPGVRVVREVCSAYHADSASVVATGGQVNITIHTYSPSPGPVTCSIVPRRFAYL